MITDLLPDFPITPAGPMSRLLLAHNLHSYHQAAEHIYSLPYGRNSDRANPTLALTEGRGTCSTKHALLAGVAAEHDQPVELVVGFYAMSERNTPGVGHVLERHSLESLPEAHCYLRYRNQRVDLTREAVGDIPFIDSLIAEERIVPEQIGDYKVAAHRREMERWLSTLPGEEWTLERAWSVREECIRALGAM